MPSSAIEKIKLGPRLLRGVMLLVFVAAIGGVFFSVWHGQRSGQTPSEQSSPYQLVIEQSPELPSGAGRTGGVVVSRPWVYYLKPATTFSEHQKGLSGTKQLGFNQGMVFIYGQPATQCFWMKDMHYSLDIIWADARKVITAIEHNVSPDTYPNDFCHDGQYVIELNAGEAAKNALAPGQTLKF